MLHKYVFRTVILATALITAIPAWARVLESASAKPHPTRAASDAMGSEASPAAGRIPSSLTLDDALQLALARSPALARAQAEIEAGRSKAEYRSQLPDPVLTLGAQNLPADTLALDQSGMSMLGIGLSQKFPPPGKLGLIHRQLERDTAVLRYRMQNLKAGVVRAVRRAWLALYYDDRALDVLHENQTLYRRIEQATLARYRAGRGQAADVLKARLASDSLIDQEDTWRSKRRQAQSRLAQLLDLPSFDSITVTQAFPRLPAIPPLQTLLTNLVHHPVVVAQDDVIRAAQLNVAAARRDFYPSYEISASYAHRATPGVRAPNLVSVGISLSLPLFPGQRQDARLRRRIAQTQGARDQRDDLLLDLRRQAQSRYADYDALTRRIQLLHQTLVPEARKTVAVSLSAYRTGTLSLTEVLRAQRAVLNQTLRLWFLKTDLARVTADLDYLATSTEGHFHAH